MLNDLITVNSDNAPWILIATIAAAFAVRGGIDIVIRKLIGKTKTKFDDAIVNIIKTPAFATVILVGIYLLSGLNSIPENLQSIIANTTLSIIAAIWGWSTTKLSKLLLVQLGNKHTKDTGLKEAIPFLENIIVLLVLAVFLSLVLAIWGKSITPILASAGVAGVAVAFAAKETISNLFGGMSIFFDKPYKPGDYILIDDKYRGEVVKIGMRSTKVKTRDNVLLTIPNSLMTTNTIVNETGFNSSLRIRIPLAVSYETNLENTEKILVDLLMKQKSILKDPPPKVRFRKFAESAIELDVLVVIEPPAIKGAVRHELMKAIHFELSKRKIVMPYPHLDVHIHRK